jgi:hypothetical protein
MNDRSRDGFDLDELLRPASASGHPRTWFAIPISPGNGARGWPWFMAPI